MLRGGMGLRQCNCRSASGAIVRKNGLLRSVSMEEMMPDAKEPPETIVLSRRLGATSGCLQRTYAAAGGRSSGDIAHDS